MKPTITPKPGATEVKTSSKATDKDLTVTISSSDVKICKPQVARRGKPLSCPNRQPDRKTLAEMKKINSPQAKPKDSSREEVIEDCQVQLEDSSYADWLIQQGIGDGTEGEPLIVTKDPDSKDICKIEKESSLQTSSDEHKDVVPNALPDNIVKEIPDGEKSSDVRKTEDTKEKEQLAKPVVKGEKLQETNVKPAIKEEMKEVQKTKAEEPFDGQELVDEYLHNFQGDLSAFLSIFGTEEEKVEKFCRLKEILHIMNTPTPKDEKPTKTDGTEQKKEIKDEKPEIKVKQEDNIEPKKETEVVGAEDSAKKEVNDLKVEVDENKEPEKEEILQTDGAAVHKIIDTEHSVESAEVKDKNGNETEKETETKQSDSDTKTKKVQFQLVVTMDEDELSEKNLHIDIDDSANEIYTGLLDNASDVNTSGDTDIIDSQEIPCSQMPHTDPYQKNSHNSQVPDDISAPSKASQDTVEETTDVNIDVTGSRDNSADEAGYETKEV